jgi:hypothetical protein
MYITYVSLYIYNNMAVGPIFAPQQIPMISSFFASAAEAQLDQCEKSQEQAQQQVQGRSRDGLRGYIWCFSKLILWKWDECGGILWIWDV